jgi:hypothetical protein
MNCWHCDRPAHGTCRFCGRAVCRDHVQTLPYITEIFQNSRGEYKALVIANTIYCGVCQPREEPITVQGLDQ